MKNDIDQLCDSYGVLLRRDALEYGIDDDALRRLVRGGALIRMRQGAYAQRRRYLAADDSTRHRMLSHAVITQYRHSVCLSHASSVIMQGGPDWALDLGSVDVTHHEGGGRRQSRIVHHKGEMRVGDLRMARGHPVTTPARAVLEVTGVAGVEAGLVQANHFLHRGEMSIEQLHAQYALQREWPGSLWHHPLMHLANSQVESVGESRCLYFFWTMGLPAPEVQHEIFYPDGTLAGRSDFAFKKHRLLVEFDGLAKYHRLRRPGESISDMVLREKRREDLLRELTQYRMLRLIWVDLETPRHTARRLSEALAA